MLCLRHATGDAGQRAESGSALTFWHWQFGRLTYPANEPTGRQCEGKIQVRICAVSNSSEVFVRLKHSTPVAD